MYVCCKHAMVITAYITFMVQSFKIERCHGHLACGYTSTFEWTRADAVWSRLRYKYQRATSRKVYHRGAVMSLV